MSFLFLKLDTGEELLHTIHMKHTKQMKRTNLVLNEESLNRLVILLGQKTYSNAVQIAIDETIKSLKARSILRFMGKNIWSGDLSKMREDR